MTNRLARRFRALFRHDVLDAELDEEIRLHVELETEDLMRTRGLSREEAHRQAMVGFGGVQRYREAQRDARGVRWIEQLAQDVKYAVRSLRKSPGFTTTIVLVLALGVGANVAMYSLVDRLFFREPSGIVDPQDVLIAYEILSTGGYAPMVQSPPQLEAIRNSVHGMATVALEAWDYEVSRPDGPYVARVTDNYLPMLGARLRRGRTFTAEEAADSVPVAIVSYRYWQRALNGDTAILGRGIEVGTRRYTVVGVAAPDFNDVNLQTTDIWLPLSPTASGTIVLRKARDVSTDRLNAAMTHAIRQTLPPNPPKGFRPPRMEAAPLVLGKRSAYSVDPELQIVVRVAGVAAIILIVAVANVATLLLMRAMRRRREIAVRLALGVSRGRLARQLLVEGILLSLAAATAALLVGLWGGGLARARLMAHYRLTYPLLDWRLVGFTLGIAISAGVLASLAPGIQATNPELAQSLQAGARGDRRRSWFRGSLVVAQAALSVVLVVGAGLFVRSLEHLHQVPLGIDVDQLAFAEASFGRFDSASSYVPAMEQEAARLAAIPGVQGAAVSVMPPLSGEMFSPMFRRDGDSLHLRADGQSVSAGGNAVGPGYLATVGMRLLDGRDFTSGDTRASTRVIIVSQTLARQAWPGRRAVGQCLILGHPTDPCAEVVGVVSDANLWSIKPEHGLAYYQPIGQASFVHWLTITVRRAPAARRTIAQTLGHDLGSRLPASAALQVRDLRSSLDARYGQWTEGVAVFSAMGALALIVAAIGMYSIIGYGVGQRMHEMGVRVALGAGTRQVMGPVIFGGLKLALAGVVLGIGAALMLGRLVASLLYGTSPRDPATMIAAAAILLMASVVASFLPARRAARVDPVIALRAE